MRILVVGLFLATILASGCAHKKAQPATGDYSALLGPGASTASPASVTQPPAQPPVTTSAPRTQPPVVTPASLVSGKVVSVNATARFVVLSFPVGHLPAAEQRLGVYRGGQKMADIKVTNQQLNEYIVADILEGDADAGDEVR